MISGQSSVLHLLHDAARVCPNHVALIDGNVSVTYRDYVRSVSAFAEHLCSVGAAGKRVILLCQNSVDFAIALYGIYAAGGQAVPVSPIFTEHELRIIITDCTPAVCIGDSARAIDKFRSICGTTSGISLIQTGPGSASLLEESGGRKHYNLTDSCLPKPGQLANLLYTGGTTGRPKGVNLTHSQQLVNLDQRQALVPLAEQKERILCFMPMCHSFAMSLCVQGAVHSRNTLVVKKKFHPQSVLESLQEERITCLPAGPTALISLLVYGKFDDYDLSTLQLVISGSAALPLETLVAWERATGSIICEGYGQTEAGPVLTFNPRRGLRKPGTVGVVVPETTLRIVDTAAPEWIVETGVAGEICASGPQLMRNYHNRPAENAEALRDGWLFTGDIGFLDEDGYLTICDRKKDMVIVSGYNVYPREVNEVLLQHPDVVEAATIGVEDAYRGEVIHSFIATRKDRGVADGEMQKFCERFLASYKIPIAIHSVDVLPKTSIGKIDLVALRQRLEDVLEAQAGS